MHTSTPSPTWRGDAPEVPLLKKHRLQLTNLLEFDGVTPTPRMEQDARKRLARLRPKLEQAVDEHERIRLLNDMGSACFEAGLLDEAEEHWSSAFAKSELEGVQREAAKALDNMGLVALARLNNDEAAKRFYKAMTIYRRLDDASGLADIHLRLGAVNTTLGRWDDAELHFEAAVSMGEVVGDRTRRAIAHDALGPLYRARGRIAKAEESLMRAAALYRDLGDQREYARILGSRAELAHERANFLEAEQLAEQSLGVLEQEIDKVGWALQAARLAPLFLDLGKPKTARERIEKARAVLSRRDNPGGMGMIARARADLEARSGRLNQALKFYHGARRNFLHAGDQRGMALAEMKVGLMEEGQGQYEWARQHYASALPRFRKLGDLTRMSEILRGLGRLALEGGRPGQAGEYFQQAFDLDQKVGNPKVLLRGASYLADINSRRNKSERALEFAQQCLTIAADMDKEPQADTWELVGQVQERCGNVDKAREAYQKAAGIFAELESPKARKIQEMLAALNTAS